MNMKAVADFEHKPAAGKWSLNFESSHSLFYKFGSELVKM
jgi:hypothetical protein